MRLCLEKPVVQGDQATLAANLISSGGRSLRLWWRIPAAWSGSVTSWADPFVVGLLFPMMQQGGRVQVEGRVSPSLLANLETFTAIWRSWYPDRYRAVDIRGDEETECPAPPQPGRTIMPFSRGVDSSFTLYRHRQGLAGRRSRQMTAAMVMHGFDIALDEPNSAAMYDDLLIGARLVLDSIGVACIPVAGNFRQLPTVWGHSFATHLVSGMRLLAGEFDGALIANDLPYHRVGFKWASNPLSNPFLGSRHFQIADDGGEENRKSKIKLISQWPQAMEHLRVCFENPGNAANCCRCEKCIRTMLVFRVLGLPIPPAFVREPADDVVRRVRFHKEFNSRVWMALVREAKASGRGDAGWVRAMRSAVRRNSRRQFWGALARPLLPIRNAIRTLFRGSPLSRRELAEMKADSHETPLGRSSKIG